jgi:hypothetical protein
MMRVYHLLRRAYQRQPVGEAVTSTSTEIDEVRLMTRYEAATVALSTWLAKARAPREDAVTPEPGGAPEPSLDRPSLAMRLWRFIGGGDPGIDSHR